MNARLRYLLGSIASIPLLPLLYVQGKRIRSSIPSLPEATGTSGVIGTGSPLRLLTLGESTMAGVGVTTHAEGFNGTLATTLAKELRREVHWRVHARSGYTVKRLTHHILPKITDTKIDLIVIGMGGNDAFRLNTPSKWRTHLNELILATQAKFPDVPIVFINMPPIKEFPAFTPLIKFTVGNLVEILGEILAETIRSYDQVYYYDEVITLEKWSSRLKLTAAKHDFFSDGVHPSRLTYQVWAQETGKWIKAQGVI